MAERFTDFVLKLASDPRAVQQFKSDPDAEIKRAGLSSAEQAVLASGNPALLREAIAKDIGKAGGPEAAAEWVIVVVWVKSETIEQTRQPAQINLENTMTGQVGEAKFNALVEKLR